MKGWIAILLLAVGKAFATPACVSGSLSSYMALGTGGCTFQSDSLETFTSSITFRSFAYSGDPSGITVDPDFRPWAPGMLFNGFQTAPGASLDTQLTFEIDAPATSASFYRPFVVGSIDAQESICVGSPFASGGSCPTGELFNFALGSGANFASTTMLGVIDHFAIGGGAGAGVDNFDSNISDPVPYGFCECGFLGGGPVPEPGTIWLIGLAAIIRMCALVQSYWRHSH